jgi:prepilin-type N-terminal cleavage/methylation domain-containing protein
MSRFPRRPLGASAGGGRGGFSLIEILVVIGLIAFLTAAIVAIIPRVGNSAKVAATRATIKKVDEMLNDRINGFNRWIANQDRVAGSGTPAYVLTAQGLSGTSLTTGNSLAAAKVLAIKILFKTYFAQTYSELDQATQNANPRGSSHQAPTDSAECLYLIITKGALFDTEPPSAADLKSIETADTDGDGLQEIVDAWGHPLRFYRWPTRLVRPGPYPLTPTNTGFVETSLTPASILLGGTVPRGAMAVWQANTSYSLGAAVLAPTPAQTTPFSLIYRCVATTGTGATGTSSSTVPTWPVTVGATVGDGQLTWQALIDPLSADPDDPLGLATAGVSEPLETPNTWNTPLIVSSGGDLDALGLFEPYDTATFGNLAQPKPPPAGTTDASNYWRDALYGNITNRQK